MLLSNRSLTVWKSAVMRSSKELVAWLTGAAARVKSCMTMSVGVSTDAGFDVGSELP